MKLNLICKLYKLKKTTLSNKNLKMFCTDQSNKSEINKEINFNKANIDKEVRLKRENIIRLNKDLINFKLKSKVQSINKLNSELSNQNFLKINNEIQKNEQNKNGSSNSNKEKLLDELISNLITKNIDKNKEEDKVFKEYDISQIPNSYKLLVWEISINKISLIKKLKMNYIPILFSFALVNLKFIFSFDFMFNNYPNNYYLVYIGNTIFTVYTILYRKLLSSIILEISISSDNTIELIYFQKSLFLYKTKKIQIPIEKFKYISKGNFSGSENLNFKIDIPELQNRIFFLFTEESAILHQKKLFEYIINYNKSN